MNLLWVLPRYGTQVTGGAEAYVGRLLAELTCRGHRSTVLTTFSDCIQVGPGYRIDWPPRDDLPPVEEVDGLRIERFAAVAPTAPDRALALALSPFERRRRRIFDSRLRGSRYFPHGWWAPEVFGEARVLWSSGDSVLRPPAGSGSLCLEVLARTPGTLEWRNGHGQMSGRRMRPRVWELLRIASGADAEIALRFRGPRWRHGGRTLAFAARRVRAWRDGAPVGLFEAERELEQDPLAQVREMVRWGERRHRLEELGSRRYRGPRSPALLARLGERLPETDAVVAGYFPFTLAADVLPLARHAGRPFLLLPFAHANDSTHHYRWHYRLLRGADRVLALSEFNKTALFDAVGGRTAHVGGGASHTCTPAKGADVAAFRKSLAIPPDAVVILTVARKTAYKGYREVLAAVTEANRRGARLCFLWVGPDEDGQRVESPFWRHAGRLSETELCLAYRGSDVFCLFSECESFGMVVLDAWQHRLPVIVNRRCGPTSELVAGGAGLTAGTTDLEATLERLAADPGLRRRFGEAGHAALARHEWSASADRFEAVLEQTVGAGAPPASR